MELLSSVIFQFQIFFTVVLLTIFQKCTTMEIMYVGNTSSFPNHLGSKIVQMKGVGPGYSMTLFQMLANAAGYDPVRGPGSSCNSSNASGQCVVPWVGGTKAVSSVVLIANGASFAVSFQFEC